MTADDYVMLDNDQGRKTVVMRRFAEVIQGFCGPWTQDIDPTEPEFLKNDLFRIRPAGHALFVWIRDYFVGEKSVGFSRSDFTPFLAVSGPPPTFSDAATTAFHSSSTRNLSKLAFIASGDLWVMK
jgi:hypothetical protein